MKPITPTQMLQHMYGAATLKTYQIKPTKTIPSKPQLITILWNDAKAIGTEWTTNTHIHQEQPEPTISTGWLWKQTNTHTTLVNLINTNHIGGGILIPNGCITQTITHT